MNTSGLLLFLGDVGGAYMLLLLAMWGLFIVFGLYAGLLLVRLLAKLNVYVQLLIDKAQEDRDD